MIFGPDRVYFIGTTEPSSWSVPARSLPVVCLFRLGAEAGALISFGLDIRDMLRHAAAYADRLLRGARPADLPIEKPTRFELVVILKTAKALNLRIPQQLLLRADSLIE